MNEMIDDYYVKIAMKKSVSESLKVVKSELSQLERIYQRQKKTIDELELSVEKNRKIGDMLYSHLNEIQFILQKIAIKKNSENHGRISNLT